jgi:hypothetical protein
MIAGIGSSTSVSVNGTVVGSATTSVLSGQVGLGTAKSLGFFDALLVE